MKALLRIAGLMVCAGMIATVSFGQAVGDYGSAGTNNAWNTASNWVVCVSAGTWSGATVATLAPTGTTNVWILSGDTVTLPGSGNCLCNNLTIEAGGLLKSANVVTSPRYCRVYGSTLTNNGTVGGTNDGFGIQLYGGASQVLTFTGTGTTNVGRIQPQTSGQAVIFDANVGINYAGGSGTGSTALYCANGNFTVTINAGKTVTMAPFAYVSAHTSSQTTAGNAVFILNVNGTLITGANGTVNLNTIGPKYSKVTVGPTGALQLGGTLNAYIGPDSIIVNAGGTLSTSSIGTTRLDSTVVTVDGAMTVNNAADFSVNAYNVSGRGFIGGSGSFTLGNTGSLRLSVATGLEPTNGPVRTTTRTFSTSAGFTFLGNALSFVPGSDFPNEVGRLTLQDTSGTLTLASPLKVDTALNFVAGTIVTGANTLTLGGTASLSGYSATNYVDGTVARTIANPGAVVWPIGLGSAYLPTTLYCSSVTTPGSLTMSVFDTATTPLAEPRFGGFKVLKHYISAVGGQTLDAQIDSVGVTFLAVDVPAGVDTSSLQVKRSRNNNQWASLITERIDTVARQIIVSGDMGDGNWIVTGPGPAFSTVSSLNFGTVTVGQSKEDSVVVTNIGNASLQIDSVGSTSAEFVVSPATGSLAAGATEKFYITYSPTSAGAAVAHVIFYNNGINWTDSLVVTGSLYATFTATTDSIDFGTIARNASKMDSVFVANNGNIALSVDSVKSSDPSFSVSPTSISVVAGTATRFTITYHPTTGGAKAAVLVFYSNSSTHPDTVWVKGDVLVAPAFSATPTSLNFGTVFTGQNKTDSVTVTNTGTATLDITSIASTNGDYTVTPTTGSIGVDATMKFYIQFAPSVTGTRNGKIAFNHNATSKDTIVVSGSGITLGTVKAARLAANGTEVVFEAIVTRAKGNYTYVQDTSAGICMYQSTGAWKDSVTSGGIRAGDKIRVDGATSEYSSLKEISAAGLVSFTILSRDNPIPTPQLVTVAQITAEGENHESELVKVVAVSVDAASATTYAAATTYAITDPTDATHATSLRIPNAGDSDVDGTTILPLVTFTGVIGQYSSTGTGGYQLMAINANDLTDNALSVNDAYSGIPETFSLENNYPNPFNPSTTILYGLPQQSRVSVKVYSILGQEVRTLVDEMQNASFHRVQWNGKDNYGMQVSSGVYFFRINAVPLDGKAQSFMQVRKMMLMK